MRAVDDPNYRPLRDRLVQSSLNHIYEGDQRKPADRQVVAPWLDAIIATAVGREFVAARFGSAPADGRAEMAEFLGVTDRLLIFGEATVNVEHQGSCTVRAVPLARVIGWRIERFHGFDVRGGDLSEATPREAQLTIDFGPELQCKVVTFPQTGKPRPVFTWAEVARVLELLGG